ncbi:DUF1538 domain-containing protein [Leptospira sp. 96542]|nr:DUF1538 domain-containing protein [Leptospira sp. 96542]
MRKVLHLVLMARNEKEESIHIGFRGALSLIFPYFQKKIWEQTKSVVWIVLYLVLFQLFVLRIPIKEAALISFGIFAVILGLTFFLEGLFLGLMPLGEIIGLRLPQKIGIIGVFIFSFLLGVGATLAEPAISVLKACGKSVLPWDAPLLYFLLDEGSDYLFLSIATGVGLAVILGVFRFLYGFSLSKLLFPTVILLLFVTIYASFDENLQYISGLAWDSGAVTTGPVTVPLVVSLGLGVSKVVKDNEATSGYGVVTLASLYPILAVLCIGMYFNPQLPKPMTEKKFQSYSISESESKLLFGANFKNHPIYKRTFVSNTQTLNEKPNDLQGSDSGTNSKILNFLDQIKEGFLLAVRAILPLTLFLVLFLVLILKDRVPSFAEVSLGILFAIFGLTIFNFGIFLGLNKLGNQVGYKLPSSFRSIELNDSTRFIPNFNPKSVLKALNEEGEEEEFFYLKERKSYTVIPYQKENYQKDKNIYEYVPIHGPLFGKEDNLLGYFVVLGFAFFLGFSATLAEPALSALGTTVEDTTVGTFKKSKLIQTVALGVGVGTLLGMTKVILEIPMVWIIVPSYLVLLFLTSISKPEFIDIAWDSAGVTTGPITVPLVIAMGLGIGTQLGTVDGFGILASASIFPILSVLLMGLWIEKSRRLSLKENEHVTVQK